MNGTYTVVVECLNCGWNRDEYGCAKETKLPKGTSVPAAVCPQCGCQKLWKDSRR